MSRWCHFSASSWCRRCGRAPGAIHVAGRGRAAPAARARMVCGGAHGGARTRPAARARSRRATSRLCATSVVAFRAQTRMRSRHPQVVSAAFWPASPSLAPSLAAVAAAAFWLSGRAKVSAQDARRAAASLPGWCATCMFALMPLPQLVGARAGCGWPRAAALWLPSAACALMRRGSCRQADGSLVPRSSRAHAISTRQVGSEISHAARMPHASPMSTRPGAELLRPVGPWGPVPRHDPPGDARQRAVHPSRALHTRPILGVRVYVGLPAHGLGTAAEPVPGARPGDQVRRPGRRRGWEAEGAARARAGRGDRLMFHARAAALG